ncbi:MAG TPA: hypothetical protein VKD08_12105 [Ignavibacteriaceae bacterium]|jgi:predicted RNA binding protein with dsRBD fold (UPF0201 family)|nr:hypothetical protein [Ignavibacteriaceae bacterium]
MLKIELNLSEEDLNRVITVLKRYISDLSMEIADTDSMEFREDLKNERVSLQKVLDQLIAKKS